MSLHREPPEVWFIEKLSGSLYWWVKLGVPSQHRECYYTLWFQPPNFESCIATNSELIWIENIRKLPQKSPLNVFLFGIWISFTVPKNKCPPNYQLWGWAYTSTKKTYLRNSMLTWRLSALYLMAQHSTNFNVDRVIEILNIELKCKHLPNSYMVWPPSFILWLTI